MKSFLNNCRSSNPADPAEVKAILFAAGACVLFIFVLTAAHRSEQRHNRTTIFTNYDRQPAVPVPPVTVTDAPPPPKVDMNARFREVPAIFRGIDFMTRSYGTYHFSDGTARELVLVDGKFQEYGGSQNSIDLDNVFYTDLTGDGRPEALVLMTHRECGKRCDGGKSLVYVYAQDYPLRPILKYESGSGMDGCSLKSLTVKDKQLTLDLFGKCPQTQALGDEMPVGKTYDVTRTEYFFNGKQLVPKTKTLLTVPNNYEVTSGVEVRIFDNSPRDL